MLIYSYTPIIVYSLKNLKYDSKSVGKNKIYNFFLIDICHMLEILLPLTNKDDLC